MRRAALFFIVALVAPIVPSFAQATKPSVNPPVNLARHVAPMNMNSVSFEDAIGFFRDASGLNVVVDWHALELMNVTRQTPITLKLSDVTLRRALQAILDQAGGAGHAVTYYVEDGIVEITSRDAADHDPVTRVYPVDDLLMIVPDFAGPTFNLQQTNQTSGQGGGGGGSGGQSLFSGSSTQTQDTPAARAKRADDLVKSITSTIRPEIWRDNGGSVASMRYFNGYLIVTAPRSVQDAISRH